MANEISMAKKVSNYFRLYGSQPQVRAFAAGADPNGPGVPSGNPSILWSLAQFVCLVLGILASPFVTAYKSGKPYSFELSVPVVVFTTVVAIQLYPIYFKKSSNTTEPKLVQLLTALTMGITYQSALTMGAGSL